jgi:hypothetical protein
MCHQLFRNRNWMIVAKSVYISSLLYPLIMGFIFNTKEQALFVDITLALFYTVGNLWLEFVIGSALFVFVEFPIKQLI